jgi:predicted PurR-regulated permease PerM
MAESQAYERIRRAGVVSWSLVGIIALVFALLWLLREFRIIWTPLILAIVLVYLFNPLVERLARRKVPRVVGGCLSYIVFGGLVVLVGFLIVPLISNQAAEFAEELPELSERLSLWVADIGDRFGVSVSAGRLDSIATDIQDWLRDPANQEVIIESLGQVGEIALGVVEIALLVLLAPVLALYILMDAPGLRESALRLVPQEMRSEAAHVGFTIAKAVGGFVRGQLLVALIVGLLSSLGLLMLDLPFWLIVGLIAGFLNIVPFVGPWVGGLLGTMTAVVAGDLSKVIWVVVIFVIIQQLDNHLISPVILRYTVKLHPVSIILALLVGGSLGGLFGVLVAVPITAVIKILLGHVWRTRVLDEPWPGAMEDMFVEVEPGRLADRIRRVADLEVHEVSHDLSHHDDLSHRWERTASHAGSAVDVDAHGPENRIDPAGESVAEDVGWDTDADDHIDGGTDS